MDNTDLVALVVDDDEGILAILKQCLEDDLSVRCVTAPDGLHAIQVLETLAIDVVVTDEVMPGMNGVRLLESIRSRWPDAVRVLCTGHYGSDVVIGAVNRGGVHKVICKPFGRAQLLEDLQEVVNEALARTRQRRATDALSSARVLIVDDEVYVGRAIARLLSRDEHQVATATSGEEALRMLGSDDGFDAVLCDLNMPGMDGMQLHARVVERHPSLAERIVFMTGGTDGASRAFLDRVPNLRLSKPCPVPELKRIMRVLARGGGRKS
jgi:CheY-like chemotaxis protein